MANLAAWIPSKGATIQIGPASIPEPGSGEVVIEARLPNLVESRDILTILSIRIELFHFIQEIGSWPRALFQYR